jgi:geranylgeranyl diphosphate synthase, type I
VKTEADNYKSDINRALERFFQERESEYRYDIVANAFSQLQQFTLRGGKRIRPILTILASKGYRTNLEYGEIVKASIAFELLQSHFLIHDDIIDSDDLRRGEPTVHEYFSKKYENEKFGNSMGLLVGDLAAALMPQAILGAKIGTEKQNKLLSLMSYLTQSVIQGESMELYLEKRNVKSAEIFMVYRLKTASYSAQYPLLVGAVLGNAGESQTKTIYNAGANLGIAYQIEDDLLGLFGDPTQTGKPFGTDIRQGRKTYPIIMATELLGEDFLKILKEVFGKREVSDTDLLPVIEAMKNPKLLKLINTEKNRLLNDSIRQLKGTTMEKVYLEKIIEIANFMVNREY